RSETSSPASGFAARGKKAGVFLLFRKFESDFPIMLALFGPILAHFREQEQMRATVQQSFQLLARQLTDGFDGLAALAQRDRFLAIALDIDHLFDADRAVLALFPFLGLHRAGIGKFVMEAMIDFLPRDFGGQETKRNV